MNKTTKLLGVTALTIAALTTAGSRATTAAAAKADLDKVPMTLTGCVVAGEAKDSFLLTHVTVDGPVPHNVFYRLDTTNELKKHVGQRVEVQGYADMDDKDKGKVKVDVKDGKVKTEVTSERKTVKIESPDVYFGSLGAVEKGKLKADVATYKVDVKSVKRLEGNCS